MLFQDRLCNLKDSSERHQQSSVCGCEHWRMCPVPPVGRGFSTMVTFFTSPTAVPQPAFLTAGAEAAPLLDMKSVCDGDRLVHTAAGWLQCLASSSCSTYDHKLIKASQFGQDTKPSRRKTELSGPKDKTQKTRASAV